MTELQAAEFRHFHNFFVIKEIFVSSFTAGGILRGGIPKHCLLVRRVRHFGGQLFHHVNTGFDIRHCLCFDGAVTERHIDFQNLRILVWNQPWFLKCQRKGIRTFFGQSFADVSIRGIGRCDDFIRADFGDFVGRNNEIFGGKIVAFILQE